MLTRKDFLDKTVRTAGIFTAAQWMAACSSVEKGRLSGKNQDPLANAKEAGITEPILMAALCGLTAPNPHNTQAWKFQLINEMEMFLSVDESRLLPMTDPPARQIHIGQGCFLECLAIGASRLSMEADINLFPSGVYDPENSGKKPVAHIRLKKSSKPADPLYSALEQRATNRSVYSGVPLAEIAQDRLISQTSPKYSRIFFNSDEKTIAQWRVIFEDAFAVETNTLSTNEESRVWFRYNDEEIYSKRDGISLPGNGTDGIKRTIIENFFMHKGPESWNSRTSREGSIDMFRGQSNSAGGFALFISPGNSLADQVNCGRDYARFHLAVTAENLVMQPFSQVLQEYAEMNELRQKFESMIEKKTGEKIQMIVRLGRSEYRFFSPRRPLKSFLITG